MHSIGFNASYCVYLTPPSVVPPGPPTVPLHLPAFAYFFFFPNGWTTAVMRMKMLDDRQNCLVCHRYLRDGTERIRRGRSYWQNFGPHSIF